MYRNSLPLLLVGLSVIGSACGGAANTNNANTTNKPANVAVVNTSTPAAPMNAQDKINAIANRSQSERDQVMANAQKRAQQSLDSQRSEAQKQNDELKRKIQEGLNNSNH